MSALRGGVIDAVTVRVDTSPPIDAAADAPALPEVCLPVEANVSPPPIIPPIIPQNEISTVALASKKRKESPSPAEEEEHQLPSPVSPPKKKKAKRECTVEGCQNQACA